MTRLRGWAPRGERLVDKVPQGKWKTATFLAALRNDRIDAPCLFDGPINGERFHAYVEQFLVPTLKPGDVVILDNLGSHKGRAVRKAIRDVGARLVFLPKYSPDLNPIEQVFAKFKTLLRKAGARSYEAISDACGKILAQYPPAECAAYLKNAGYANPWRLDLDWRWHESAIALRCIMGSNPDAHSTLELDFVNCGVEIARISPMSALQAYNTASLTSACEFSRAWSEKPISAGGDRCPGDPARPR